MAIFRRYLVCIFLASLLVSQVGAHLDKATCSTLTRKRTRDALKAMEKKVKFKLPFATMHKRESPGAP
jgi:hypothetical protein